MYTYEEIPFTPNNSDSPRESGWTEPPRKTRDALTKCRCSHIGARQQTRLSVLNSRSSAARYRRSVRSIAQTRRPARPEYQALNGKVTCFSAVTPHPRPRGRRTWATHKQLLQSPRRATADIGDVHREMHAESGSTGVPLNTALKYPCSSTRQWPGRWVRTGRDAGINDDAGYEKFTGRISAGKAA